TPPTSGRRAIGAQSEHRMALIGWTQRVAPANRRSALAINQPRASQNLRPGPVRQPAHGGGADIAVDPATAQLLLRRPVGGRGGARGDKQQRGRASSRLAGTSPVPSSATGPAINTRSSPTRHPISS